MSEDYLWDRRGVPDSEVERLEHLLGTFRHAPAAPFDSSTLVMPASSTAEARQESSRHVLLLIAASLVAAVGAALMVASSAAPRPAWEVSTLEGSPTIAEAGIEKIASLPVGEWLETGASARARIDVGGIGRVDVDPHSRIRLTSMNEGNYRLRLARGTMHAIIWAPPGQFFVDTPSSTAIDLGCAYTLQVGDDGAGTVKVDSGWVGFQWRGKESFIPAGAMCATRPGIGPGTPHYPDVSPAFAAALGRFDFESVDASDRADAVATILTEARPADAVTLWHLLQRVEPRDRDHVFDRLAAFVPPPPGVTHEGVRAGRRDMFDRWWNELGFGSMDVWRRWQQQWRER